MAACTNLPSKLSRALCAYLVSTGIDQRQVVPHYSNKPRTFDYGPIVTPFIYPGDPEPKDSGDRRFKVGVSIKGTATQVPNAPNPEAERVAFDAFVGKVNEALMQTDDADNQTLNATRTAVNTAARLLATAGSEADEAAKEPWRRAANNADMADFTLVQWNDSTYGAGEAKDCNWEIVIMFDGSACELNVD